MKTCSVCRQSLSEDSFHKRTLKSGKIGLQSKCKKCSTSIRKKYYKPHSKIRGELGLSQADIDAIIAPGACQSCGSTSRRLCIDHKHGTKKPRGLLCHNCNTALGLLKDEHTGLDSLRNVQSLSRYLAQSEPLE